MVREKLRCTLGLLMQVHTLRGLRSIYDINLCDQFFFENVFLIDVLKDTLMQI